MSKRIDHAAEALKCLKDAAGHYALGAKGAASLESSAAIAHSNLAIAEQLRIANLIALASLADDRWSVFAGEAGSMGSLFDNPETELGNMRLKPEIREVLGL